MIGPGARANSEREGARPRADGAPPLASGAGRRQQVGVEREAVLAGPEAPDERADDAPQCFGRHAVERIRLQGGLDSIQRRRRVVTGRAGRHGRARSDRRRLPQRTPSTRA